MNRKIITTLLAVVLSSSMHISASPLGGNEGGSLKETVGKSFLIGTALSTHDIRHDNPRLDSVIAKHFNAIVAENCMKVESLQPVESLWDWRDADETAYFAAKYGLTLTGHVLVWHSQTPKWFWTDDYGNPCDKEQLLERIRTHVKTVVTHFKGKVKGWDVVNEAIEDDGSYRKSFLYNIGGPEFIEVAFRAAMEADPDCELYLNDYSMASPKKRAKYCEIIRDLKSKGIRIDAIGMQSHSGMDYPNLEEYEKSIEAFGNEGVKVMVTELDLNCLPNPPEFNGAEVSQNYAYDDKYNPYRHGLSESDSKNIEKRWMELWKIYYKHRDVISRVTLWGVYDKQSWLNNWPVFGRTNFPLLFDRNLQEKPVVKQIEQLFNNDNEKTKRSKNKKQ